MEHRNTETAYKCRQFVGSFRVWILCAKIPQKESFAIKKQSTQTTYNWKQIPYLEFTGLNTEKHVSSNRKSEYGYLDVS